MTAVQAAVAAYVVGLAIIGGYAVRLALASAALAQRTRGRPAAEEAR